MNGPRRRFTPSEIVGDAAAGPTEADLAEAYAAARALEAHALADRVHPTDGFEDRVMAALSTEPAPRLVLRAGPALGGGRPRAFVVAVQDAWAIATGRGRPLAVRAQAIGFLMVVIVAAGSLGTVTAVGVGSLLQPGPAISPSVAPAPTASPAIPSPTVSPTDSASPSIATDAPTGTPEATETIEPTDRPGATGTPEGTDDHGGSSASETPDPTHTVEPSDTPNPGETLKPGETVKPGETPRASDDHGGGSGDG